MQLGVMPPPHHGFLASPDRIAAYTNAAEDAGFESIWVFEHMVIPSGYSSRYPYSPEGRISIEDEDIPDPLTLLAFLAGVSQRINLGTGVLILPQRSPVLCAKGCATVDALSGGRLRLGIGVGWLREEAETSAPTSTTAARAPRGDRGERGCGVTTGDVSTEVHALLRAKSYPSPPKRAHPDPRRRPQRHRRAPRGASATVGSRSAAGEDFGIRRERMRVAARAAGRDPDTIENQLQRAPQAQPRRALRRRGWQRWIHRLGRDTRRLPFERSTRRRHRARRHLILASG